MKALVIEPFPTTKGIIPAGQIIEISLALLEKLKGRVEAIPSPQVPEALLTETGELRTRGMIDDLAAVIVGLTADNLPLQRELLARHCEGYDRHHEGYDRHHIEHIWGLWEERAAVMEHDGGLSRRDAEYQAAERLHLLAFLDIRAAARSGNRGDNVIAVISNGNCSA